jgi:hypothetical protein
MKLPLNQNILNTHKQLFPKSCVTMCVELVLKLMNSMPANSFDLQIAKGDISKSGVDFDKKTFYDVFIKMGFDFERGPLFPLEPLFNKIKCELDEGNYVNCAWRPSPNKIFHAFVIYGYEDDEFLAITKYYQNSEVKYINDMKTKLIEINGSDILTFSKI